MVNDVNGQTNHRQIGLEDAAFEEVLKIKSSALPRE